VGWRSVFSAAVRFAFNPTASQTAEKIQGKTSAAAFDQDNAYRGGKPLRHPKSESFSKL
jgi:hypothetical protein